VRVYGRVDSTWQLVRRGIVGHVEHLADYRHGLIVDYRALLDEKHRHRHVAMQHRLVQRLAVVLRGAGA